jgi:agmatine/peptidylarginine deiminase
MKKILAFALLLAVCSHLFSQEPLPKGMTEAEKLIWKEYLENYPTDRGTAPPAETPRTPGEWDESQAVVITWTSYTSVLREIVRYAKETVKVYIVCSNASTVQSYLTSGGVSLTNIEFVVASYNSVWVRDYGPQSIYLKGTNQLAIVDWVYNRPRPADDEIPTAIATAMGLPIYQMTVNPNKLVATGGNLMFDGFGKAFSSKLILDENSSLTNAQVDTIAKKYWGVKPYVKMNTLPYDGIHHIDMHMKLLDEETLMVGQYPQGVADGPQIEANLTYVLNNFQTPYGRPYKVVRIPMPPSASGYYPNSGSDYYTYTNSVILNNTVLVPQYGLAQDQTALDIYASAMPGYNIVGINSSITISASGSIHCITHEIAANDPIFIAHPSIREATYSSTGFPIWAHISSASGITSASLQWKNSGQSTFNEVPMTFERDTFWAAIPKQLFNAEVQYYIKAENGNGKILNKPLVAPNGYYTFTVTPQGLGFDFNASTTSATVGEEIVYTYSNDGIVANTFEWNFGEGATPQTATGEGPHTVTYSTIGNKNVTLTVNGTITIEKQDLVSIAEGQPTYYSILINVNGEGTTIPEAGEHSYLMGQTVTLTANPSTDWAFSHWAVNEEVFEQNAVDVTLNENITATAFFTDLTTTPTEWLSGEISIYPNPVKNILYLNIPETRGDLSIKIYSITGELIFSQTERTTNSEIECNLNFAPAGVYFVKVTSGSNTWSGRVVKLE